MALGVALLWAVSHVDDVLGDIKTTDEELEGLVEILYIRADDEYRVLSRHRQSLYLDHGGGPFNSFEDALANAIETARSEGLPLLQHIYTYAPESQAETELGVERIPIPWADEECEDDSDQ